MGYNERAIKDKGGNLLAFAEIDETYVLQALTEDTNAFVAGHISNSEVGQETSKEDYKSEDSKTRATDFEYNLNITGVLMQTDKATIDNFAKNSKDKLFLAVKYQGVKNGKYQEVFMIGNITPKFKMTTPGGASSNEFEFTGIFPNADLDVTGTMILAIESALGISVHATGAMITAADGFDIKETSI